MGWSAVVLEVICSAESGQSPPKGCRFGIGRPGVHCFVDVGDSVCPFASWSRARASVALTDTDGDVIRSESFSSESMDTGAYLELEESWLRHKLLALNHSDQQKSNSKTLD